MSSHSSIRIVNAFGRAIKPTHVSRDEKMYFLRWSKNPLLAYGALSLEALLKKIIRLDNFEPKVQISVDKNLGEVWTVNMPDSLLLQGLKNMSIFRESLNHDFEYLVTTITSTYLNLENLQSYLDKVSNLNFAGGRIEKSGAMFYQQGSFRVYSRDVVGRLVSSSKRYPHWKIEDIAMGSLVSKLRVQLDEIPNTTLSTEQDVANLTGEDIQKFVSYRCKSMKQNKRNDPAIMKALQNRVCNS